MPHTLGRALGSLLGLLLGLAVLLTLGAAPARADSPSAGGDVSIAQTLGDRELTVVLRRVTVVPGPLHVDVITHSGVAAGILRVSAVPTGVSAAGSGSLPPAGSPTTAGQVVLGTVPGTASTVLTVDRAGPWELVVDDGTRTARIPFVVPAQVTSPPERLVYGGYVAAGVLLLVTIVVAVRVRRTAWTLVPAAGLVAALAVAVTAAVLSASLPLPPQPGTTLDPTVDNVSDPYRLPQPPVTDYSRPPVTLTNTAVGPVAGRPADLALDLADGATGLPVDDLVVHDSALVHLLIVGPSGRLWHLHPIRVAPGRFVVHLAPPEAGHYALSLELVRRGGGVQLVRSATGVDVAAGSGPAAPDPGALRTAAAPIPLSATTPGGAGQVGGVPVTVSTTMPTAGRSTTITTRVGDSPTLQPWLGMVGHLIVAGPLPDGTPLGSAVQGAPVWAHAHSMGGMGGMAGMSGMAGMGGTAGGGAMAAPAPVNGDSAPDETVAAYGPDVPATFTFPTAGRYRVWLQVERAHALLTVPIVLDVAASGGSPEVSP